MRSFARVVVASLAGIALLGPSLARADDPARAASCASLLGGTAGVPKEAPIPDPVNQAVSGLGTETATPSELAVLPARVELRTTTETFNRRWWFALLDGKIYVRPNEEHAQPSQDWRRLVLPLCIDGRVASISADDEALVAVDRDTRVYTMDHALDDTGLFNWSSRWGAHFWVNLGIGLPPDAVTWSQSVLTANPDQGFTDPAGNFQTVSGAMTVYVLRGDRHRITYLDPWLPTDYSYEVCGPERGRLRMAGLSASGSTVFVAGEDGSLWTRLYDFDTSGSNTVLYNYAWDDQRGVASPRIQLPGALWLSHSTPPGPYTNVVSIEKISPGTDHRILRVEGTDGSDNTGYWQKDIIATEWTFHETGRALHGIPGAWTAHTETLVDAEDLPFANADADIPNFNPYCSPATLRVHGADGSTVDLVLHTVDGLRQEPGARGLNSRPHEYYGAIEVPQDVLDHLDEIDPQIRGFIATRLGNKRFSPIYLSATPDALRIGLNAGEACWEFARQPGGGPLHTEGAPGWGKPPLPRDLGSDVAAAARTADDGTPPARCQ